MNDLCRRSYINICGGGVFVSILCRRIYIGIYRGGVCVTAIFIRNCRGGIFLNDLFCCNYIDI